MTLTSIDLSQDPEALLVYKLPVERFVVFPGDGGVCQTLEGPVSYNKGDAVVTGARGERWPIAREKFNASYDPIKPTKFGEAGIYRARWKLVLARRLTAPIEVQVGRGQDLLQGRPGDWLIQYSPGEFGVVDPAVFTDTYRIYQQK